MKLSTKRKFVSVSRTLSRFFQVKVEIRMFGRLVWSYVWPPDSDVDSLPDDDFVESLND